MADIPRRWGSAVWRVICSCATACPPPHLRVPHACTRRPPRSSSRASRARCSSPPSALAQTPVVTQHNDHGRTGANLSETVLTTTTVNVSQFGKLFERTVDDEIYGQPLYVPGVTIPGLGVRNVVYVATNNDSVYAFDADNPAATAPLWRVTYTNPAANILPFKHRCRPGVRHLSRLRQQHRHRRHPAIDQTAGTCISSRARKRTACSRSGCTRSTSRPAPRGRAARS